MTTAAELIEGSLRLIGQLAEEETPSAATSQDALTALNQMIDSWNTERLMIYNTVDQVFNWPPNERVRTLGPSGNFVGLRPVLLDDSTYFKDTGNGLSFGIQFINQEQYDGIAFKTVTTTYPQVMWINMEYPNISMAVYPIPIKVLEWHFISVQPITQPVNLASDILLPPGYVRAFRYNLAVEFCNEFGVEPMPRTARIAMISKRNLKRINNPDDLMSIPYPMMAKRQRWNIYTNSP